MNPAASAGRRLRVGAPRMNGDHFATQRIYQLAEGQDLEVRELNHLRDCASCRDVLRILTHQYIRRRGRNGSRIQHLSLAQLFQHAQGWVLSDSEVAHLTECQNCVGVLTVCRMHQSLILVVQTLKKTRLRLD